MPTYIFIVKSEDKASNTVIGSFYETATGNLVLVNGQSVSQANPKVLTDNLIDVQYPWTQGPAMSERQLAVKKQQEMALKKQQTSLGEKPTAQDVAAREARATQEEKERQQLLAERAQYQKGMMKLETAISKQRKELKIERETFNAMASLKIEVSLAKSIADALLYVNDTGWIAWDNTGIWSFNIDGSSIIAQMLSLSKASCMDFKGPYKQIVFKFNFKDFKKTIMRAVASKTEVKTESITIAVGNSSKGIFEFHIVANKGTGFVKEFKLKAGPLNSAEDLDMQRLMEALQNKRVDLMRNSQVELTFEIQKRQKAIRGHKASARGGFALSSSVQPRAAIPEKNIAKDITTYIKPADEVLFIEFTTPANKLFFYYDPKSTGQADPDELRLTLEPDNIRVKGVAVPVGNDYSARWIISVFKNLVFDKVEDYKTVTLHMSNGSELLVECTTNDSRMVYILSGRMSNQPEPEVEEASVEMEED